MTSEEIIDSFKNSWKALCQKYDEYPDEPTRRALNLLSKIIREVEGRIRDNKDVSKSDWLEIFIKNKWY